MDDVTGIYWSMREMRKACKILVIKPEWKKSIEKPSYRWEYYITVERVKRESKIVDRIYLAESKILSWDYVNTAMNIRDSMKGKEFLDWVINRFWRRKLFRGVGRELDISALRTHGWYYERSRCLKGKGSVMSLWDIISARIQSDTIFFKWEKSEQKYFDKIEYSKLLSFLELSMPFSSEGFKQKQ